MSERRSLDPTNRFSDRAGAYHRSRPTYPPDLLDFLSVELDVPPGGSVAELGSGTGILTDLLLARGLRVFAVEPNDDMRGIAEEQLGGREGFTSVGRTAEDTGLDAGAADLVVAAQAFHWFDPRATRAEAARILQPGGSSAFVWNHRLGEGGAFREAYESFLREWGTDYARVSRRHERTEMLGRFFGPEGSGARSFANRQELDLPGLEDRLVSSSYMPGLDHPRHQDMLRAAEELFRAHEEGGRVTLEYETRVFFGRPAPG